MHDIIINKIDETQCPACYKKKLKLTGAFLLGKDPKYDLECAHCDTTWTARIKNEKIEISAW